MKSDLYDPDAGFCGKVRKHKICLCICATLIAVITVIILLIKAGKIDNPIEPQPEPEPDRSKTIAANTMLANFQKPPNFAKYNNGDAYKTNHWDNQLYGGPITNGILVCNDTEKCKKPNNMTQAMTYVNSDKDYHGYFVYENIPSEVDASMFLDIMFYCKVTN